MAVALGTDAGDELAHPATGQGESLGHGPLAQRLPGGDRRHVRRADRLLHIPGTSGTAGTLVTGRGARDRRTCCIAISTEPMNATAGHAEISALSTSYPAPKAVSAPTVVRRPSLPRARPMP
jgi:hypothetical protein